MEGVWAAFVIAFGTLFLSELGDKTQVALIAFSRSGGRFLLALGAMLGFAITAGLAVAVGATLSRFVALDWIRYAAAALFIAAGIWILVQAWRRRALVEETEAPRAQRHPFVVGLVSIALLEMGDKTQLAEVALAARLGHPLAIFFGAWLALCAISVLAILAGQALARWLPRRLLELVAGVLFVVVGVLSLVV